MSHSPSRRKVDHNEAAQESAQQGEREAKRSQAAARGRGSEAMAAELRSGLAREYVASDVQAG